MSVYMTEEEQIETLKKWWSKHGNLITTVLSIVLLCIAGYKYWHWHQEKLKQESSIVYENMMVAFANHDNKSVRSYANELIKDHSNSVYADVAHMTLAKLYVSKEKLDLAINELEQVAAKSNMPALKQIAKIRIARLLTAGKSYNEALDELAKIDDSTYLPVINELRGDIYGNIGKYDEAIKSYRLAIDQIKNNGMGNLYLEMKTNELAIKNQSLNAEPKKVQPA